MNQSIEIAKMTDNFIGGWLETLRGAIRVNLTIRDLPVGHS